MGGRYAEGTEVPTDRSRAEIERTLTRYGATAFMYGWDGGVVIMGFRMHDRMVRFRVPMPDRDADEFWTTPTGRDRSAKAARDAYEQATRQRWRALALVVKAKLEAVESGITTFEEEFLAHIVLPDGQTVGQWVQPQVARSYEVGTMPSMLPGVDETPRLGPGEKLARERAESGQGAE